MSIVTIDMQIRDERVLAYLRENAIDGKITIAADSLADRFKCHPHTARAILRRLMLAGYISVDRGVFKGGFTYQVKNAQTA